MHESQPQPAPAELDQNHPGLKTIGLATLAATAALATAALKPQPVFAEATPQSSGQLAAMESRELSLPTPVTQDRFGVPPRFNHLWNIKPSHHSTNTHTKHNRHTHLINCEPNPNSHQRYARVGKAVLKTGETVYNKCLPAGIVPQDEQGADCKSFPERSKFTIDPLYPTDCRVIKKSELYKRHHPHTHHRVKIHHWQGRG